MIRHTYIRGRIGFPFIHMRHCRLAMIKMLMQRCPDADAYRVHFGIRCDGFGAAGAHIKIPSDDFSKNKLHCRSFHWNSLAFHSAPWWAYVLWTSWNLCIRSHLVWSLHVFEVRSRRAAQLSNLSKRPRLVAVFKLPNNPNAKRVSYAPQHPKRRQGAAFVHLHLGDHHYYYYGYGLWLLPNIRVSSNIWLHRRRQTAISHSIESNN